MHSKESVRGWNGVERDIFQDYIAVIGTVEPIRTIYLDAIEGGRVEIEGHYIARIETGLTGSCDFAGTSYPGRIIKIYPEVENGRFYADMVFTGEIPRGGFYQSTGGQWVYVINEDEGSACRREISIGRQNPRYYEVLSGLREGERVIVSGYDNFGDAGKLILK